MQALDLLKMEEKLVKAEARKRRKEAATAGKIEGRKTVVMAVRKAKKKTAKMRRLNLGDLKGGMVEKRKTVGRAALKAKKKAVKVMC